MIDRNKKILPSIELFGHLRGERGKKYFSHLLTAKERYAECIESIQNPNISAIVEDRRQSSDSTHQCIFKNKSDEDIVLPLAVYDDRIEIITLYGIADHRSYPKWFHNQYDSVAEKRSMPPLSKKWRPNDLKY